jgi:hypothetical protein
MDKRQQPPTGVVQESGKLLKNYDGSSKMSGHFL